MKTVLLYRSVTILLHFTDEHRIVSGDQDPKSYRIFSIPHDSLVVLLQERMEDVAEDVDANRFSLLSMMISSPFLMLYR